MMPPFDNTVARVIDRLARIAEADADAHVCEEPRGSNAGPKIAKYFAADNYSPAPRDERYPWCAAAVSFWLQQFLALPVAKPLFGGIEPPRISAAFAFAGWGLRNGCYVFSGGRTSPQRGDIVIYRFSHIGIVTVANVGQAHFVAVEGNTDAGGSREGWEVARRPRTIAEVRQFVRLSPRALPVS